MKKITHALFGALLLGFGANAQTTYEHVAPPDMSGTSSFRAPNGTAAHAKFRNLFYVHPYEMLPMNLATINSASFQLVGGTGSIDVVGNFTLYLANSTAMNGAIPLGTNFVSVFASMTKAYVGTYTVPATAGATTVGLNFTTPFNYTGGGLLVGVDFNSTGPFAANSATYTMNYQFNTQYESIPLQWTGTAESTSTSAISNSVQTTSNFRPSMIWGAVNTATTNELEVANIDVEGFVPSFMSAQSIKARVVNSSTSAVSSVSVAFEAAGANPYKDTIVLNSMLAGEINTVTFNYTPLVAGESTITITTLNADQVAGNNSKSYTQSVSCTSAGHHPSTYEVENGYGFGSAVLVANKHKFPATATLTGVRMRIGDDASNDNKQMAAVLLNSTGGVISTGSLTIITSSAMAEFSFPTPQVLTANTEYFIGVSQPTNMGAYYPFAFASFTPYVNQPYYVFNATGGTPSPRYHGGYFMIEPVLENAALNFVASADRTFACKGESVTLTATGGSGMSYTWNPGVKVGDQITVTVQPVGSQSSSPVFMTVVGTHTASQCQTEASVITVSVSLCTGLGEDLADYRGISLFPNPAEAGFTRLQGLQGKNTVEVTNIAGQRIQQFVTTEGSLEIDLSALPRSAYFVKVSNDKQQVKVFKVLTH